MHVEPLGGFNKGACGTKLLPTTVLAYPANCTCVCSCHLIIEHTALLPVSQWRVWPASGFPPTPVPACLPACLIHATYDITAVVKKLLKIRQC